MKVNFKTLIPYLFILSLAAITALLIAFDENIAIGYQNIWILPFFFGVVSIFSINVIAGLQKNIIVFILYLGYFIRFVMTPLFLRLGNYKTMIPNEFIELYMNKSITLMVYELIIIFIFLEIYLIYKNKNKKIESTIVINQSNYKLVHFSIFSLSFFCILILIIMPELMAAFTSIFSSGAEVALVGNNMDEVAGHGTVQRILGTMFIFTFNIIRYLIPIYLLKVIYTKFQPSIFTFIISIAICLLPFLIISESNIQPFFSLIFNVIVFAKLYPRKRRFIKILFSLLGSFLVLSILISKMFLISNQEEDSNSEGLAVTLNAYFPGVGNTAAAFNIPSTDKWSTLFTDIFSTIPFRNSLFPGISNEGKTLTELFNNGIGTQGNIISVISGSEFYLGFVFAPLLPLLITFLALKMEERATKSKDYWYYFFYIFIAVRLAIIPTAYNHVSILTLLLSQFIPIFLLVVFLNRENSKF